LKKKYSWAKYNAGDGVVEIVVRDETGSRQQSFTVNQSDKKKHRQIAIILYEKYGIDFIGGNYNKEEKGFFDF